jgi:mannose-6-phosphate isomerase-like protein (cupin superfamily)
VDRAGALRTISQGGATVSVQYRCEDLEVMVVRVDPGTALVESTLWESPSWHLVVEGQATFQQGDKSWDVLPDQSLQVEAGRPYTIANNCGERLKLLTVMVGRLRTEPGNAA